MTSLVSKPRFLGVDYGTKKTGLAVSGPFGALCSPLELDSRVKEFAVSKIIVGWPLDEDGAEQEITRTVEDFIGKLKKKFDREGIEIEAWDERYSSMRAREILKESGAGKKKRNRRGAVDAVAAVVILEEYLEANPFDLKQPLSPPNEQSAPTEALSPEDRMIHPIVVFGSPVLREKTKSIEKDSPELQALIQDMFETMRNASGVGLAAPQIGRNERLFVVGLSVLTEMDPEIEVPIADLHNLAVINPEMELLESEKIEFEEGCLSIPDLREFVTRPDRIKVKFLDQNFEEREMEIDGLFSRVFQHEFDHLDGVLFIDKISGLRRKLLKRRLKEISNGLVEASYPVLTKADLI